MTPLYRKEKIAMDKILIRFSDVAQDIFKQLDNENLAKCREVNKVWCKFIENGSLLWRRRIQKFNKNQIEFQDAWKLVTNKASFEKLREIALTVEEFYKFESYIKAGTTVRWTGFFAKLKP